MIELLRCRFPDCPTRWRYAGRGLRAKYCAEHAAERKHHQNNDWRRRRDGKVKRSHRVTNHTPHTHQTLCYRVISDPDDAAGYPCNARLRCVEQSLAAGVLTSGMVLEKSGRRYVVEGASGARQKLVEV